MAITVNIYYSGVNGKAKKFAEEMVSSGVVSDIRAEAGNLRWRWNGSACRHGKLPWPIARGMAMFPLCRVDRL